MSIFRKLFVQLVLACSMLAAAGQAAAGPLYQVRIDTASLGTGPAYLGLYFLGLAGASEASARVFGLVGAFDGAAMLSGSVASAGAGYRFTNANGGGELVQAVELGGVFRFNVEFEMDPGLTGATFGYALFDETRYLGADGDLGLFQLTADGQGGQSGQSGLQVETVIEAGELVRVVPEPSGIALLLAGAIGMLAGSRRRR